LFSLKLKHNNIKDELRMMQKNVEGLKTKEAVTILKAAIKERREMQKAIFFNFLTSCFACMGISQLALKYFP
jgi:hypothetical protein